MKQILFNANNANWCSDERCNLYYLKSSEKYFNDLIKARGYLYLNQIYETLGEHWDPNEENMCFKDDTHQIWLELTCAKKDSIIVHIHTVSKES